MPGTLEQSSVLHNTAWESVYPKASVIWQFSRSGQGLSLHGTAPLLWLLKLSASMPLFHPQTHNSHFYPKIEEANCPPILNLFFSHMWPLMPLIGPWKIGHTLILSMVSQICFLPRSYHEQYLILRTTSSELWFIFSCICAVILDNHTSPLKYDSLVSNTFPSQISEWGSQEYSHQDAHLRTSFSSLLSMIFFKNIYLW